MINMPIGKCNNPNNKANLKPIKKGEVRNPKGRGKNKLKHLKAVGLNKDAIMDGIAYILTLKEPQLKTIKKSLAEPIWKKILASAVLADYHRGEIPTFDSLLDRMYGRPTTTVHQTTRQFEGTECVDETEV